MADVHLLSRVKACLRVTTTNFDDDEIAPLIEAAFDDLKGAGVDVNKKKKLVEQAVIYYCKAHFGLAPNKDWERIYEQTRDSLASRTAVTDE